MAPQRRPRAAMAPHKSMEVSIFSRGCRDVALLRCKLPKSVKFAGEVSAEILVDNLLVERISFKLTKAFEHFFFTFALAQNEQRFAE